MTQSYKPASLFKRLAVIGYDGLLLIAILFIATALTLPLNGGEAIKQGHPLFPFLVIYCSSGRLGYCFPLSAV